MKYQGTIPIAPVLAMPEPLQTIFFWVSLVGMLAVLVYSLTVAKRLGSLIPIFLVCGAFCSIPLEPLCSYLGHAEHPVIGNILMFTAVDRAIPWHIAFDYTIGFGLVYLIIFQKALAGGLTRRFVFYTAIIVVMGYYFGEIVGVANGLWVYFQPQPLWPWRIAPPPTWSFLNATAEILGACLVVFMLPHLKGSRQILVVVLCPVATLMGHFGAGFPFYTAINSAVSPGVMNLAAVFSIVLCVFVWWIAAILATTRGMDVFAAAALRDMPVQTMPAATGMASLLDRS